MNKIRFKTKIIFLAIFVLLLGTCIYADAVTSTPRSLVNICILGFMMHAYMEKQQHFKILKEKSEIQEFLLNSFDANSPDLLVYFDENQRLVTCNRAMCNLLGVKYASDAKNSTVFNHLCKDNALLVYKYNQTVLKTGKPVKYSLFIENEFCGKKIYETISVPVKKQERIKGLVTICRDITFRENLRKKFIDKQNRLNTVLNNLPMAAFLIDTDGRYISGNTKISELLNVKESCLIENNIFCKFLAHSQESISKKISIVKKEKRTSTFEHLYNFYGKNPEWYRIYMAPVYDIDGNVDAITVFLQNIEAEKNISRQKEHYIATLTHDLKTPIIAQKRSLELILKESCGNINPEQKELLELTLESCNHMYNLVSAILYSYKFDNDEIQLSTTSMNISDLLSECCEESQKLAKEKNIEIIVNPFLRQTLISADRKFLKEAILYLIENSISYAYENTKINVELYEENDEVIFKINTDSPYIPENMLHSMFDRYLGQTATYNKIGFCLKLYYSSQIIHAHKGTVVAYSDPSNKNTLGFSIPRIREEITAIA